MFKENYKDLISEAISVNAITIEKFVIAENVENELDQLIDEKGHEKSLLRRLKNHHRESDRVTASIIYLLKQLDPAIRFSIKDGNFEMDSNLFEVKIRPRIDGKNAEPRLFFPKKT